MSTTPESFGRYQLLKVLARGGMGEVHLARQAGMQGFEKLVVIKRILPHLAEDDEFIQMFLDEARIAANLNHPNIVQIYDLGREGDYYFIAMEYIHGDDMRRLWKKALQGGRKIPPALACRIIAEAAAGLDYAHKKTDDKGEPLGIVHRDISPHNILVTFDGGVKVIDFGIARARNRMTHTATGAIKGRFEYMSPEHASGLEVDGRSDVFALGVVLWETLTGARLFKRDSETATLVAVSDCHVPAPSTLNPEVPPALDAVVLKALARLRTERYPDAGAFRLALEDFIVEGRMPASSAHLGAFMRELYADRLATEQKLGKPYLDETTGSNNSRSGVAAADNPTKAKARPEPESRTNPTSPTSPTTPATHPGPAEAKAAVPATATKPSRGPLVVGLAVVLVMGVAGALLAQKNLAGAAKTPDPLPVPAPAPVAVAPTPAPPPTPAPSPMVLVKFDSEPAGAEVLMNGVALGKTPLELSFPRSERPATFTMRLDGYRPYESQLSLADATSLKPVLQKLDPPKAAPVTAAAPPPATPALKAPPALDIKIAR